jgi:DNA adenine methylase
VNVHRASPLLLNISSTHLVLKAGQVTVEEQQLVQPSVKPFVKWPGGKQWLAGAAPHLVPVRWRGRYYEPFAGGAAFFFALEPALATLSDRNWELMTTYRAIRGNVEAVMRLLKRCRYDEKFYYQIRESRPRSGAAIAARLLYLNRTCWNGLYRVNRKGRFNTPFGRFTNPTICDAKRLGATATLLRRARLRDGDFDDVVSDAKRGDLVYFDPPYITGHQRNGFLKYNAPLFSWADQQRLARVASVLAGRGVQVLISNADHSTVSSLYVGFHHYRVHRKSLIAGPADSRGVVTEVLLSSYPILNRPSEVV